MRFTLCLTFYYVACLCGLSRVPRLCTSRTSALTRSITVGCLRKHCWTDGGEHGQQTSGSPLSTGSVAQNAVFIAAIAAIVLAVTTGPGVGGIYRDCRRCVRVLL